MNSVAANAEVNESDMTAVVAEAMQCSLNW